jgi:hypothetical protein
VCLLTAFQNVIKHIDCGENICTSHGINRVWSWPDKRPGSTVSKKPEMNAQGAAFTLAF